MALELGVSNYHPKPRRVLKGSLYLDYLKVHGTWETASYFGYSPTPNPPYWIHVSYRQF